MRLHLLPASPAWTGRIAPHCRQRPASVADQELPLLKRGPRGRHRSPETSYCRQIDHPRRRRENLAALETSLLRGLLVPWGCSRDVEFQRRMKPSDRTHWGKAADDPFDPLPGPPARLQFLPAFSEKKMPQDRPSGSLPKTSIIPIRRVARCSPHTTASRLEPKPKRVLYSVQLSPSLKRSSMSTYPR